MTLESFGDGCEKSMKKTIEGGSIKVNRDVNCSQEKLSTGLSAFDIISAVGSLERLSLEARYAD